MRKLLIIFLLAAPLAGIAQSETTQALQKRYSDSFSAFFYRNTLRMLNQTENKEFDELIKNIEKMKFLLVDKVKGNFMPSDYKQLVKDYEKETYEPIVTSRHEGKSFDIYMKEKNGSTLGTVVLVNDSTSLYVLDILGSIDVTKVSSLFSSLEQSSDIGRQIQAFLDHGDNGKHHKGLKID